MVSDARSCHNTTGNYHRIWLPSGLCFITVRKRSCRKVMFSERVSRILFTGACVVGGSTLVGRVHAWQGGMHFRGACMASGHAWQGGMHGKGACIAGGHAWQEGVHGKGVCMVGWHAWQEIRPLQRTVCILLECILVKHC